MVCLISLIFRFRYDAEPAIKEIRNLVSKYVKSKPENIVFVENASSGFNAVFYSLT